MIPDIERVKAQMAICKVPEQITRVSFWFQDQKPTCFDVLNPTASGSLVVYVEPKDNLRLSNLDFCAGLPVWITYQQENTIEAMRVRILREKLLELNPPPETIGFLNGRNFFFENLKTGKRYINGKQQEK